MASKLQNFAHGFVRILYDYPKTFKGNLYIDGSSRPGTGEFYTWVFAAGGKFIHGYTWALAPSQNYHSERMDFPSSFWMFQKLHIRVHGFSLRPLDFPRICMSEYMDFSQALGFSGICISEYMDFPPALGFSKNLYVRVHGFFFPPQFYTSIFLGKLNHLFSKTWPCKKNMYNFDFGKK